MNFVTIRLDGTAGSIQTETPSSGERKERSTAPSADPALRRSALKAQFARPGAAPFYTQTVADNGGAAEIKIEVAETELPDLSLLGHP